MPAVTKNLIIEQKATFRKKMTWRDKLKRPINLTGFGARMQIRAPDGSVIADLSTENFKITLGGALGTIEIVIPVSETSVMTFTTALYDLKLIAPNGDEIRFMQGKVTLSIVKGFGFLTTLRTEAMVDIDFNPLRNRDGRRLFSLISPLNYQSKLIPGILVVDAGFVTDYGSVPRLPVVYSILGEIAHEPYVIHDMMYSKAIVAREVADRILAEALRVMGIPEWKCEVIYEGARIGGESHYNK